MYILLTLFYAIAGGVYEICKKTTSKKSNALTSMALFSTGAFLLSLIWIPFLTVFSPILILTLVFKGLICAINIFLVIKLLKSMNISGLVLTVVISTILTFLGSIFIFHEQATLIQYLGCIMIIVCSVIMTLLNKNDAGKLNLKRLILLVISSIISTLCSFIDKFTNTYMPATNTQFWFLLSLTLFSWIFILFTSLKVKTFIVDKKDFKNFSIYLAAILLFLGDIALFAAYSIPNTQLILISSISKMKTIFTVLFGVFLFKENHKLPKILITILAILGVVLIFL